MCNFLHSISHSSVILSYLPGDVVVAYNNMASLIDCEFYAVSHACIAEQGFGLWALDWSKDGPIILWTQSFSTQESP